MSDNPPPSAPEVETALLGSVMLAPDAPWVADALDLSLYHVPANASVAAAMVTLRADGRPIDMMLLVQALREAGQLEAIGGVAALSAIYTAVPTAVNSEHYMGVLRRQARLRALIADATALIEACYAPGADPDQLPRIVLPTTL